MSVAAFGAQVTGFSSRNSAGSQDHVGGQRSASGSPCDSLLLTEGKAVSGSLVLAPSGVREQLRARAPPPGTDSF